MPIPLLEKNELREILKNGRIAQPDPESFSKKKALFDHKIYHNFIRNFLKKIDHGTLSIVTPDNQIFSNSVSSEILSPQTVHIHDFSALRRLLFSGILGFCESYLDKQWSTENIASFYTLIMMNEDKIKSDIFGTKTLRFFQNLAHRMNKNTRANAKKNISFHYDLGNAFYAEWLDASMTYSSAYFKDNLHTNLYDAQLEKYDAILRKLKPKNGQSILEIGCGWGGFAERAISTHDIQLKGLTISQKQLDFALQRMADNHMTDKADLCFLDYRDLGNEKFDFIVSIEMFEAVGEEYWQAYFQTIKKALKPQGRAVLQIITIGEEYFEDYRKSGDYIQRYIFPGGMLPTETKLIENCQMNGLEITDFDRFGKDYAHTLLLWNMTFQTKWDMIKQMGFDDRFKRIWEMYLAYCAAGFLTKNIDVVQITIEHSND